MPERSQLSWARRVLLSDRAVWWVAAAAMLAALPSTAIGFYTDDYTLFAYLTKVFSESPPWYDLYRFVPGDPQVNRVYIDEGFLAWWSAPELRVRLLRPLSSVLFSWERAAFGDHALLYHVHSLAWFAGLLAALWSFYRRLFTRELAALALLVYGVSSANLHLYGWVSARHLLLSTTFVALALGLQERAQRENSTRFRGLSWLSLVLGLLCGESGLCGLIFAGAYAVAHAHEGGKNRPWRAALPYLAGALGYLLFYAALGGGAKYSGMYISPLASPAAYLKATVVRVPALIGNALWSIPADFINVVPPASIALLGLVAFAAFGWLVSRIWSTLSEFEQTTLRWLGLAALISLPAMVGGSPGSRMLAIPNIGFAPVCAAVLLYGKRAFEDEPRGLALTGRGLVRLFGFTTLVLAPLQLLVGVAMHRSMADKTRFVAEHLPSSALRADTRLVMVASSDPLAYMYPRSILGAQHATQARCWSVLSGARADHRITRVGERELMIAPIGRTMLQGEFEGLYRAAEIPLRVGDEVEQCGLKIRVAALQDGKPSRIHVAFDAALDDPTLSLVEWKDERFVPFVPPAVGQSVLWKWSSGPTGLF
ncbi:MAG: hypothetical protein QM778_26830 [Myxococcales bacterium]